MLCTNCNMTRAQNEEPCQHCGAPSPLLQISQDGSWGWGSPPHNSTAGAWNSVGTGGASWEQTNTANGAWGNNGNTGLSWGDAGTNNAWSNNGTPGAFWGATGNLNNFSGSWNNGSGQLAGNMSAAGSDVPQLAFDAAPSTPPTANGWPGSEPAAQGRRVTGNLGAAQSLLPALYQGNEMALPNEGRSTTMTLQLLPDQMAEQLLPAIPDRSAEDITYVPPMYTAPRPIIPKYRAISGLLAVLIVSLLICTGVGYYAKTTGKLTAIRQFITGTQPLPKARVTPPANIPDPKQQPDYGPAVNVIPSATLTSRLDPSKKFAVTSENIFKPRQMFYITFTVQKQDQQGTLSIQWYTNKRLFKTVPRPIGQNDFKDGGTALAGVSPMVYDLAAEGMVELYWNNQLAQRLYFAVR